jgi:aspartate racemase
MKTIGVLGGMGPQATMDFEARVHRESQSLIPPRLNTSYPPLVVAYHRRPPVLMDERDVPIHPLRLDPELLRTAERVGRLADFLVVTSNTPHLFQREIEEAAGIPMLSMIEATLDEVRKRGWKRVGVLGLGEPTVYTAPIAAMGGETVILEPALRSWLDSAILRVMEGRRPDDSPKRTLEAVDTLRGRGVDGVILGCTEIPLLLEDRSEANDLVNPLQLVARAAVLRALE